MSAPSPELLLSLSPAVLRSLVSTFGPLPGLRPNATTPAIARAIFEGRATAKLARVLAVVARFGGEPGRRAIMEAGRARRDARVTAWLEAPPADVAAGLAVECATLKGSARRAAERVLALAGLRLERELAERATYELIANAPVPVDHAAAAQSIARGLGTVVHDLWTRTEADGSFVIAVFVRTGVAARLVLEEDRLVSRVDAPVAVDLVRVHAGGSRASFTLASPELLPRYASALGLGLRPSVTLKPLHDLTAERLARTKLPRGMSGVTIVARRRRKPDGSRYEMRAFDVLDPAHEEAAARSGYVDRSTLRGQFGERAIDAFLQLPHRLEISDGAFEREMREALGTLGILEPGAMPDDSRSLEPYEHGDWRWRIVVNDEGFEWLVANKRLVRAIAAHVVTEEHRMHGAGYVVRDVPGESGVQYALAEDRSLGARLVGKADRLAWRLDLNALAAAMRWDLGATAVGKPAAFEIEGVIDLGVVALPSGKLRFVYAMGTPPKGWLASVVRACGIGVTVVVMVPAGHGDGLDGVLVIELDVREQLGVKRVGRALGKAAEALGVAGEVEKWRLYDEEIVIDAKGQRVWVLGVSIPLNDRPHRFLEYLARHPGRVTSTKELGGYVSTADYPDVTARKVKKMLEQQVRKGLVDAGVGTEIVERLIVADARRGYRLGVGAKVV